ncbi:MAG: hypothetical protein HC886_20745 [Leptolyngbyaceae cyanobacterium SM1_1_3]|nr:hypothetical protein [Leptolyngbyaceae cyanobacterium SM1_1_3]NJM85021.1 hypothetical protein [Leptolyngbyaceae cyanobacterium RM2_2_21]NJN04241.1 hypothetical protein [Leptolyngbyaceae cyanobacterium RM1_1_2]NJO10496.1 hypothetical protein [Leptolyngbyaceae cyanobacterium SL_1_1]
MWQQLRNLYFSISTYHELSPDLQLRRQVNQALRSRERLSLEEWFRGYWQASVARPQAVKLELIEFVYSRLRSYSGLDTGRLRPSDRLVEDLQFPSVCWFDWSMTLCNDFCLTFGVYIGDRFDETQLHTLEDLVNCLHQFLTLKESISS